MQNSCKLLNISYVHDDPSREMVLNAIIHYYFNLSVLYLVLKRYTLQLAKKKERKAPKLEKRPNRQKKKTLFDHNRGFSLIIRHQLEWIPAI